MLFEEVTDTSLGYLLRYLAHTCQFWPGHRKFQQPHSPWSVIRIGCLDGHQLFCQSFLSFSLGCGSWIRDRRDRVFCNTLVSRNPHELCGSWPGRQSSFSHLSKSKKLTWPRGTLLTLPSACHQPKLLMA